MKKNLPGLVGAGLGAVAANFVAGRRAYLQAKKDNEQRFATWSEKKMPLKSMRSARRIGGRRYRYRRSYRRPGKVVGDGGSKRLVRTSPIFSTSIAVGAATSFPTYQPTLGSATIGVYTADLTSAYRLYRIRKVVLHVIPRIDEANSGLANNYQTYVAAACDPEDTTAASSLIQVTAYDNSYQKWITGSDRLTYTFYPKAVNVVWDGTAASSTGSYGMNPWLQLNATGLAIPHRCLKLAFNTGANATVALNYDMYLEYHFDVKGIA